MPPDFMGPLETRLLAEPSFPCTEHYLEADGVRLRYLEGGEGPTVVLVHGRGGAATLWLPYLKAFSRQRRVLALDLPGFGHSQAPPGKPADAEAALAFFVRPVEALLAQVARGPFSYVGHSLGGLVGVELCLRRKLPLERLALIGPMGTGPSIGLGSRLFFRLGPERLARWLGRKGFSLLVPPLPPPWGETLGALEHELLTHPAGRAEATAAFNALIPLSGPPFHRRDRLGEVQQPTLLLWGQHDPVFPVAEAEEARRRIPNAVLQTPPLGHSPHLESPDTMLPLLQSFLEGTNTHG